MQNVKKYYDSTMKRESSGLEVRVRGATAWVPPGLEASQTERAAAGSTARTYLLDHAPTTKWNDTRGAVVHCPRPMRKSRTHLIAVVLPTRVRQAKAGARGRRGISMSELVSGSHDAFVITSPLATRCSFEPGSFAYCWRQLAHSQRGLRHSAASIVVASKYAQTEATCRVRPRIRI